ncbi:hypothetical protein LguiB_001236 [Lonicera macranthoides]
MYASQSYPNTTHGATNQSHIQSLAKQSPRASPPPRGTGRSDTRRKGRPSRTTLATV